MKPTLLRFLLIALLITVQSAMVATIMLGVKRQTAETFESNARTSLLQLIDAVEGQTQRYLAPAESVLNMTSRLLRDDILDVTDDSELQRFFTAELLSNPWLDGLYVGRADGSFVYINRNTDGVRSKIITIDQGKRSVVFEQRSKTMEIVNNWQDPLDNYDPRLRPWYQLARNADGLTWTDPYIFFSSGSPGITAALALNAVDKEHASIIGVDINIQKLSEFVGALPNVNNGSAIIVNMAMHAIAHSDSKKLRAASNDGSMPDLNSLNDKVLSTIFNTLEDNGDPFENHPTDILSLTMDGHNYMAMVRNFKPSLTSSTGPWLLMVQIPFAEYSGGLVALISQRLRTLLIVSALYTLIALYAVFKLTKPVFRIHREASIDPLTGALNRRGFERQLAVHLDSRRSRDKAQTLVVLAMDLDEFKPVNDEHGHGTGDSILKQVIERLDNRLRDQDLISRAGGDEFVLAVWLDQSIDVMNFAEQLRSSLVNFPFETKTGDHNIGVTVGIACYSADDTTEAILDRADQALVNGKAIRKNRCYLAENDGLKARNFPRSANL